QAVVVNYRDITERRQAEEKLRLSDEILQRVKALILVADSQGQMAYVSPAAKEILGYEPAELLGEGWWNLSRVTVVAAERERDYVARAARGELPVSEAPYERLVMARGGEAHTIVWQDARGPGGLLIGVGHDITERKQAEEEIRRRAAHQSALNAIIAATTQASAGLKEVLQVALDHTLRAFGLERGAIWLETGEDAVHGLPEEFAASNEQITRDLGFVVASPIPMEDWQGVPNEGPTASLAALMTRFGIRASLAVPLVLGERGIGGLSVFSAEPRAWPDEEVALLEAIGRQLGIMAERARLLEQMRRRLAELEAVNRVSTSLRTAQTLDDLLSLLLDQTLAVMDTDAGAIWLYDPDGDLLRRVIARGWFAQVSVPAMKPAEDMAGTVFATGESLLTREFASEPHSHPALHPQIPPGWGGAVVPVRSAHEIVGVLLVAVPPPREVTPDEARLLTILAEIAGNALQRMRLHAQTERRAAQLAALHAIDQAIGASLDVHITLNVLLDQTLAQLAVHAAAVLLYNPYAHVLTFAAGRGFRTRAIEGTQLRLGEGHAGRAALERRIASIPNLAEASDFVRAPLLAGEGFVAYHSAPLIAKGRIRGVLEIFQRAPLEPDPEWLGFLETLAGQAAIAIDNAELFEDLQRSNTELSLAYDATIEGWSRALDLRDKETEGHTQRVTELT
ncbi:MAG TPA: GAF domain-containing protein, partial [Anaerolineales bacterium]|nr:GAF domain-containing protein [Anaerolineales bacterium]